MKPIKQTISLLLICLSLVNCGTQSNPESISQAPPESENGPGQNLVVEYAETVMYAIKRNDFNAFLATLPEPPFKIGVRYPGEEDTRKIITKEAFEKMRASYQKQFQSIVSQISREGIIPQNMSIDQVNAEYHSNSRFQAVYFSLHLRTSEGKRKLLIQNCFEVDGTFVPTDSFVWYDNL